MPVNPEETDTPFRGFQRPNYTQVPDELFDELLPTLSGAELKVLLYIIRRTFGFKRERDAISLSQMLTGISRTDGSVLDRGVGLSKPTLLAALRSLVTRNIIITERRRSEARGDEPTVYALKFASVDVPENTPLPPVVKKLDQGVVKKSIPPVVKKSAPQETVRQETEINLSNIRMRTRANVLVDNSVHNSASQPINPPRTASTSTKQASLNALPATPAPFVSPIDAAPDTSRLPNDAPESVGSVLKRRRGRPPKQAYSEDRQQITAYIQDFAREMGDQAPLKSSVTRADNLYQASGRPIALFVDAMYQARAKTKERTASIHGKPNAAEPFAPKAKMAYFFALLEDELGMRASAQLPLDG